LEGFGCTYKVTADGKRQILAFNPITQAEYGDALGITTVHVNRVMKELRVAGLVQTKGTVMTIPDWEALR
jgi:DNA-binding transcriptional regulator LsrR (DeoR family)